MSIKYYKLFDILQRRGMKKTDLAKTKDNPNGIISLPTLAKLSKGSDLNTKTIEVICKYLSCQPGDIMEYIEY